MKKTTQVVLLTLLLSIVSPGSTLLSKAPDPSSASKPQNFFSLRDGWYLQSSCDVKDSGAAISRPGFSTQGWLVTTVPHTVLGAQVDAGKFHNPFFGTNLKNIPGMDYPQGKIYTNLPMTQDSPYRCSWWYRTEFAAPFATQDKTWLLLNGINYRANIWLNGKLIADSEQIVGAYRKHELDITDSITPGKNVLAVEVFAQTESDLGINFVDWNHSPADKSMGLWRDASLKRSGPVRLRNPAVLTRFADDKLSAADLTVIADLENTTSQEQSVIIRGEFQHHSFAQPLTLGPHDKTIIRFTADKFPSLHLRNPQVWWPAQYGAPMLHQLHLQVEVGNATSDSADIRFGIREVRGELNDKGFRQFTINRKNILIRGAGWAPDMFYREPRERIRQEFQYVNDMNLNTVRVEGKLGSDDIFDLADEMGILIMAGWCCCDHWEHWDKWTPKDHEIARASLYDQISRLRAHPSVFVWLNGSDDPPPADVESEYIVILKEREWAQPFISSATAKATTVTGPSGVKMSGPYDYVPPEYWWLDHDKFGGAYGYNTETSPGPAIPTTASLKRILPQQSWWPTNDDWNYHAGIGRFAQFNIFNAALSATFGAPKDLSDYQRKAQWMAYDGERAMFEAYSSRKYTSTGVIQWMLNNAWPSFIWHLYDYYLIPGGGYFGTKKANEPLHVAFRYDDRTVVLVNSTLAPHRGVRVAAMVVDLAGKRLFGKESTIDVPADGVSSSFTIPEQAITTFLSLQAKDLDGKILSRNFYALPVHFAQLDWSRSTSFYSPATSYADLKDLASLAPAAVKVQKRVTATGVAVTLRNVGTTVAFNLHLRATRINSDEDLVPAFYEDNFISLIPGESRTIQLKVPATTLFDIKLSGWNLPELEFR